MCHIIINCFERGLAPIMPRTKRSKLQKAQSAGNMSLLHAGDKENCSSSTGPVLVSQHTLAATELELKCQTVRGKEYECRYRLEHQKQHQSQAKNSNILAEAS